MHLLSIQGEFMESIKYIIILLIIAGCGKEEPKQDHSGAVSSGYADSENCIDTKGKNVFENFTEGCLGADCAAEACGEEKFIFRKDKSFYAEYSCHGPAFKGNWKADKKTLTVEIVYSETKEEYCEDECTEEDGPNCISGCKKEFSRKYGREVLKTKLNYEFGDIGSNRILMKLETEDLNPVEGKEKYGESESPTEWEELGCMKKM